MFQDQEFTSRILINILNDQDQIVKALGYELMLVIFKKSYHSKKPDASRFPAVDFLPYLIRDRDSCTKAEFLLNEIGGLDSRLLFYTSFIGLFSRKVSTRCESFGSLLREDLFKIGLRQEPKNDNSFTDRLFQEKFKGSQPRIPFKDPLDEIWSEEISHVVYFGKLNVFSSEVNQKDQQISQN